MDTQIDQTLNIGNEIKLAEGIVKNIKIGSIGLIRKVRQLMKDKQYSFSYSIGRDTWTGEVNGEEKTIDFPAVEAAYREAFSLVLVDGLTDEEYEQSNVEVLDTLLDRFL
ncbi:hypothetical protein [Paenibacillus graminis]|uniref:Uncharacterized protein n=1 Tax=Paenibacillus graminis TaxID=189425 RepID=A0A089MFU2_9BACL|nr:hypothetical protein [Paenibacillus graminis]AIQ70358.1 hypothetical protein PGRAT_24040 [Paenibacillus graminis]